MPTIKRLAKASIAIYMPVYFLRLSFLLWDLPPSPEGASVPGACRLGPCPPLSPSFGRGVCGVWPVRPAAVPVVFVARFGVDGTVSLPGFCCTPSCCPCAGGCGSCARACAGCEGGAGAGPSWARVGLRGGRLYPCAWLGGWSECKSTIPATVSHVLNLVHDVVGGPCIGQ